MYVPSHFDHNNTHDVWHLINENPFATLLSHSPNGSSISHLPMIAMEGANGQLRLIGHISRSNNQWMHFQKSPLVTAIFHGPHTYITPRWYSDHDVPTWNYAVVHVHGSIRLIDKTDDLLAMLKLLTSRFEVGPDSWSFDIPMDLRKKNALGAAIVGIELEIERLEPKFKLGQNRSQSDRDGIRRGLNQREDDGSKRILELMSRIGI